MSYIGFKEERVDSTLSFERLERKLVDDILFNKLDLDAKYSLTNQEIKIKTWNEDGTIEIVYKNETREQFMNNGIKKRMYKDGLIIITLPNDDITIVNLFNNTAIVLP